MSTPLAPEERAFWRKRTGLPGEVLMAQVVARLLAERDSLERERDEAREQVRALQADLDETHADLAHRSEQVRSLTVERDAAQREADTYEAAANDLAQRHLDAQAETGRVCQMLAEEEADSEALRARLSRAREALGLLLHCGPKGYELEALMDTPEEAQALAALRAALAEPLGDA